MYLGSRLNLYNQSKGNKNIYTIFEVDINKMPEDIKMFYDPNYEHGIFISDNLMPNIITKIGHIDFSRETPIISWN